MKKIFFIICMVFAANACKQNNEPDADTVPKRMFKSYINTFVLCEDLKVNYLIGITVDEKEKTIDIYHPKRNSMWTDTDTHEIFSVAEAITLYIKCSAKDSCGYFYDVPQIGSTGFLFSDGHSPNEPFYLQRKKGFDKYTAMLGDTLYNKKVITTTTSAIIDTLSNVNIITDKDFDEDHPLGSNLNDFFTIYFQDPYSFVKNDYQPLEGTYNNTANVLPKQYLYLPYVKANLSEINFTEHPFMGNEMFCFLNVAPEKTGEYTFRINVTFANGALLETISPPINIKGAND